MQFTLKYRGFTDTFIGLRAIMLRKLKVALLKFSDEGVDRIISFVFW